MKPEATMTREQLLEAALGFPQKTVIEYLDRIKNDNGGNVPQEHVQVGNVANFISEVRAQWDSRGLKYEYGANLFVNYYETLLKSEGDLVAIHASCP